MIPQNYYQGFTKLCDRNPKMTRIPSKEELEKAGCDISGMCYLVGWDGKQYNPAVVNPEIFSDDLRALFTARPEYKIAYETSDKDEFKDEPKSVSVANEKICTECKHPKPIDQFGKKQGRGGHRKDICKECEEKIKAKTIGDITGLKTHQEPKHEKPNTTPISGEQLKERIKETITKENEPSPVDHVGDNPNKPSYVTIERVKELVTEAYQIGVKDGKQQSALNIIEPTLNDLLRA